VEIYPRKEELLAKIVIGIYVMSKMHINLPETRLIKTLRDLKRNIGAIMIWRFRSA
jgi:hypothetical protein